VNPNSRKHLLNPKDRAWFEELMQLLVSDEDKGSESKESKSKELSHPRHSDALAAFRARDPNTNAYQGPNGDHGSVTSEGGFVFFFKDEKGNEDLLELEPDDLLIDSKG
jgi:hypothetical protein